MESLGNKPNPEQLPETSDAKVDTPRPSRWKKMAATAAAAMGILHLTGDHAPAPDTTVALSAPDTKPATEVTSGSINEAPTLEPQHYTQPEVPEELKITPDAADSVPQTHPGGNVFTIPGPSSETPALETPLEATGPNTGDGTPEGELQNAPENEERITAGPLESPNSVNSIEGPTTGASLNSIDGSAGQNNTDPQR